MASLTPAPTSMIDRLEKYLLSCLQGENIEKIQICSKKHFIYVGNFQTLFIQNYIAIFSEEDPFYRTHKGSFQKKKRRNIWKIPYLRGGGGSAGVIFHMLSRKI